MGIWEAFTDLVEAAAPWSVAEAEAPPPKDKEDDSSDSKEDEDKDDDSKEKDEDDEDGDDDGGDDGGDDDDDDEEEEEVTDPKEKLEEECKESKQCAPAKHHFDECVERVTNHSDDDGAKEDCVEEFFHLAHCANQCAAPKLWAVLK